LRSNKEGSKIKLKEINKRTTKTIREDLRQYKPEKTRQTIEENRSLKVLKRNLAKSKTEIVKLQNRSKKIEHNKDKLIEIVEKI